MGTISFISAIISSLIFMFINMRPIKLKKIAQNFCLFNLNIFYSIVTLELLYICDWVLINANDCKNMECKNCGIFIWFVKIGGFNLFIATIVSLVYYFVLYKKMQAKFIEQHAWMPKAFFAIICILMVIIYVILIYMNGKIYDITSDEWERVGAWINTVLGMYIGFGTNLNDHPLKKIKTKLEMYKHDSKEDRKQVGLWFASFIIIILTLIIYFIFECYNEYISAIVNECVIGVFITAIIFEACRWIYNSEKSSKMRLKKLLNNIDEGTIIKSSFMGVKYLLKRDKEKYFLFVYNQPIELDKSINFSDVYKNECRIHFGSIRKEYVIDKYDNQIEELLLSIATNRKNLLKDGWKIVHNN